MDKLRLELVTETLFRLSLHYRECQRTPEEMLYLAEDYAKDCQTLGARVFLKAIDQARRQCRFFPKVAEILTIGKEIMAADWAEGARMLQLEANPRCLSEADCQRNKRMIQAMVSGIVDQAKPPEQVLDELALIRGGACFEWPEEVSA